MRYETVEVLKQEWHKCPFEEGLDDYITIQSEHAGRLILMQIERFSSPVSGGIRAVPIRKGEMPTLQADYAR